MQRAGAQPAGTGLGAGGCKDLIPKSSLGRSRNGGTWHRERGKKWESTKSLLLCSQEPLSQPQPAPAWAPSPPQRAGLGTHRILQNAEGTASLELLFRERKTTPKSGQECKGRAQRVPPQGGHKGKAGGTGELVQELSRAVCRDLFYFPFIPTGTNLSVAQLKPAPSWEFRAGYNLDAPGTLPNS